MFGETSAGSQICHFILCVRTILMICILLMINVMYPAWYIVDQVKLANHWSTLLAVVVTYLVALLEQSYFLNRYWSM